MRDVQGLSKEDTLTMETFEKLLERREQDNYVKVVDIMIQIYERMDGYARMIDGLPDTDDNVVKLTRIINENKDNIKKVVDAIAKTPYDFYKFAFEMKQYDGNNNTDYCEHAVMSVDSIPLVMRMIVKSNKWSKAKNMMEPDPQAWF